MNYLTPNVPEMFDKFFTKFDNIFSEQSQKDNFRFYGTGLLLEIKRKNIQYMSLHTIGSVYQSEHHFIHDAPWYEQALNKQRVDTMENITPTKSCKDGYVIFDDTGNPKSGNSTFATDRQWIGSLGKVDNGQVVVTSHYADSRKDWPIDLRPYMPKKWVEAENKRLGEDVYVFKTKLELGLELIDDLKELAIQFSHLLMDAWYGNSPDFIKGVEYRKHLYITPLYANRRIFCRLHGDIDSVEHNVKELVTSIEEDAYSKTEYTKANGEACIAFVAEMKLKIKNLPGKRRVLIFKPTREEQDMRKIGVLMSNDFDSEIALLLRGWSFRDSIDKFYQRSKDELGFDQYQVRGDRSIRRHWYMVFLMYSYIIFHRQCGSFRKWCTYACHTFGQLLDVIRTKLMLHFHNWCIDNPESWHDFLQNEKGIPKTAIATRLS
jgi:hypothetical protein